jgi:hypothetical protein
VCAGVFRGAPLEKRFRGVRFSGDVRATRSRRWSPLLHDDGALAHAAAAPSLSEPNVFPIGAERVPPSTLDRSTARMCIRTRSPSSPRIKATQRICRHASRGSTTRSTPDVVAPLRLPNVREQQQKELFLLVRSLNEERTAFPLGLIAPRRQSSSSSSTSVLDDDGGDCPLRERLDGSNTPAAREPCSGSLCKSVGLLWLPIRNKRRAGIQAGGYFTCTRPLPFLWAATSGPSIRCGGGEAGCRGGRGTHKRTIYFTVLERQSAYLCRCHGSDSGPDLGVVRLLA